MATQQANKPAAAADTKPAAAAGAQSAAAAGATNGAADAAGADAEARKRAPAANFLPIVRGRLPLIFVHAVRFDPVVKAMPKKDSATKLATSVGKVFDIQKGRNFSYVDEGFKPTADDVAAAQAWIDQTGAANAKGQTAVGDKALMTQILEQYKKRGLATTEEAAKFTAARGATRKPAAPATGGQPAAGAQPAAAASGAALLS